MDQILANAKIDYLVQIQLEGKKISVLGQNEGYMTLIDCDRLKKIKNAELMNKIFDTVKEIQEVLKIKYFEF